MTLRDGAILGALLSGQAFVTAALVLWTSADPGSHVAISCFAGIALGQIHSLALWAALTPQKLNLRLPFLVLVSALFWEALVLGERAQNRSWFTFVGAGAEEGLGVLLLVNVLMTYLVLRFWR